MSEYINKSKSKKCPCCENYFSGDETVIAEWCGRCSHESKICDKCDNRFIPKEDTQIFCDYCLESVNLCEDCNQCFAECQAKDIVFGTGIGNDNVVQCSSRTRLPPPEWCECVLSVSHPCKSCGKCPICSKPLKPKVEKSLEEKITDIFIRR
ncbi:MAG: hypothetical protein V1709_00955 [Planctomycetota bacterium]